jgi:hypothetical protein
MTDNFTRIWRLGKILHHINIPMWTCEDKHGNLIPYRRDREKLIRYSPEALQYMQNLQKNLLRKWRQDHPNALLNGGNAE